MVYAYLRVSSDHQDYENQQQGVERLAAKLGICIEKYIIDNGISGTTEPDKRNLGKLLRHLHEGDVVLVSEMSRLARNMLMMFRIVEKLLRKKVKLYSVKDNFILDDSLQSKILVFAFGIASQIERDMISARTKEALALRKSQGIHLGRPFGMKIPNYKLLNKRTYIERCLKDGKSKNYIARRCKCSAKTMRKFINNEILNNV